MFELIVVAIKKIAIAAFDHFISTIHTMILDNVIVKEAKHLVEILDTEGNLCKGSRTRKIACRWRVPDYYPSERISLGPTGKMTAFRLVNPENQNYVIEEGGIGNSHCVFRVRTPEIKPYYLIKKPNYVDLICEYEAMGVFTKEDISEPMTWINRVPVGKSIPGQVNFEIILPEEKPMLKAPRVYRINNLAKVESAITDISLDKAEGWERLPSPSNESFLTYNEQLTTAKWIIRPHQKNVAYKIEWDWWE